jgi:dephospho-CoA kinase
VKGTPGHLPPIVLTGADGAGKQTVAKLLNELAGYERKLMPRESDERTVVVSHLGTATVDVAREHGYRVVWVYAPPSYRGQRLLAAGRLQPGEDVPEDTSGTDYDYTVDNIGSEDDLRHDVAELLNRMAT